MLVNHNNKEALNASIEKVIKQTGIRIENIGWKVILFNISKYINDSKLNENAIWLCLKPLRHVVETYLQTLNEENRV